MLQAQWTYTGYDASAHIAEETVMARLNCAWGVFLSVAVSAIVGYLLLLVLTWCIPNGNIAATVNDPYPVLQIVYGNLSNALGHTIAIIIGVAMWLCGASAITSMSRMWYAFARDGGMPGVAIAQPRERRVSNSGLGGCRLHHVGSCALRLCGGVLGDHFHQHRHALPGLRDPDLPELAQSPKATVASLRVRRPRHGTLAVSPHRLTSSQLFGPPSSPSFSASRPTSWCCGACSCSVSCSAATGSSTRNGTSAARNHHRN